MAHVLFLGAGSDIARALEREYARAGMDLYLAGRDQDEMRRIATDLAVRYPVAAKPIDFDITDTGSHPAFYAGLDPKPFGVICAAGYLGDQSAAQERFDEARRIVETNYLGWLSILNVVANDFEKRRSGFIVGISSVAGDRGRAANYIYGSAKAGFSAYLSGLRGRLSASDVQVLTVKPGFVRTKMTEGLPLPDRLTAGPDEAAKAIFDSQRKGRDVLYVSGIWRAIMTVISHIPERMFKRMKF